MTKHPAIHNLIASSILSASLPEDGSAPEWVTVFPSLGKVETRDGRCYTIPGEALMARFSADALSLPVDVDHQIDTAPAVGGRAEAVAWVHALRLADDGMQARVEWLDEGKQLLAAKKYKYISASFHHSGGAENRAVWLKNISLTNTPALGNQPALAAAQQPPEPSMKTIAAALGLSEDANETSCLSALQAKLAAAVPKDVHEAALASLAATRGELDAIQTGARKDKVEALIEGALKAKKILPADKAHYEALCSTDAGFDTVAKLIGGKSEILAPSGLDGKKAPDGEVALNAVQLAAEANKLVASGAALCIADAMTMVTSKKGG